MFDQVRKFVTTFRELEKQERPLTGEEEARRKRLRQILSTPQPLESSHQQTFRRVLAIASFYPQAGASFIAGNLACYQAAKQIDTTLCEMPDGEPYFYFSLDSEARGKAESGSEEGIVEKAVYLQDGYLRVKAISPFPRYTPTHPRIASWFLANSKHASLLIIDLSSNIKRETAAWIVDLADEVWVVCDSDIPRLARTILTQEPPDWWSKHFQKIRLVANKWDHAFARSSVIKKLEGTISLWNQEQQIKPIEMFVPQISCEQVIGAQINGKFLLEMYPEEGEVFARLAAL
jgi:hypothetical protein